MHIQICLFVDLTLNFLSYEDFFHETRKWIKLARKQFSFGAYTRLLHTVKMFCFIHFNLQLRILSLVP